MEDKKIGLIKRAIVKLFDEVMVMDGQYDMPYSSSSDEYVDWSVTYKISRISIWETEKYQSCKYGGTIYLEPIEIKVGFNGDWEYMKYITDLPSWVSDDIKDSILDKLETWIPNLCVDIDFN